MSPGRGATARQSHRIATVLGIATTAVLVVLAAVLTMSSVTSTFDGKLVQCGAPVNLFGTPDIKPVTVATFISPPHPHRGDNFPFLTYDSVTGCGNAKDKQESFAFGAICLAVLTAAAVIAQMRGRVADRDG